MIEIANIKYSQQTQRELRQEAELTRMLRGAEVSSAPAVDPDDVVIRIARSVDTPALRRLSELDSRPTSPHSLVAEIDGEVLAALPLDGGSAAADPFRPTAQLVAMLELRASQLRGTGTVPKRRLRRIWSALRHSTARPAMAPLAGDVSMPLRHDGE